MLIYEAQCVMLCQGSSAVRILDLISHLEQLETLTPDILENDFTKQHFFSLLIVN